MSQPDAKAIGRKISRGKTADDIICELALRYNADYDKAEDEFVSAVGEIKKCARRMGLVLEEDLARRM